MRDKIRNIYAKLEAELDKAKDSEIITFPVIEEELIPHIIRELTEEEIRISSQRVFRNRELNQMYLRVGLLSSAGLDKEVDKTKVEDELLRFHSEIIDNLFFWALAEGTEWKYAAFLQRSHEGKPVLIGLDSDFAREYFASKEETPSLSGIPVPTVVN